MLKKYQPAIIILTVLTLIIVGIVHYVQSLINQPIDSFSQSKSELLDLKPLDNIVIPKEFEFKGAKIALAWTDDNTGEDLIIQSDKKIYYGFNNIEVYFSITNTNKQDQDMDVVIWVGDERIRVEEMERIDTEGNGYNTLALSAAAALSARVGRKDIKGFTTGYTAQDNIESGKTNYYKAIIKYPPMSKGEFFIEAFGHFGVVGAGRDLPLQPQNGRVAYGHLDPWYNSNWSYWKKITIASSTVATTTSNFPVLATSTDSDLRTIAHGGHVGNDNGYDIVFADSDGETLLNFEREKYASTTGEIVYWIKTDISSTTDKVIYMYYGNASASDLATTTGVWDDNFVMVQHMQEDPTGGANPDGSDEIFDSTKYDNDGNTGGTMLTEDQVAGQIDGSLDFDGVNDYVDTGYSTPALVVADDYTWSTWVYVNSGNAYVDIILGDRYDNPSPRYFTKLTPEHFEYHLNDADNPKLDYVIPTNEWRLITIVKDGADFTYYSNSTVVDTGITTADTVSNPVYLGGDPGGPEWFNGLIDEVRISNVARTAGWIETEYNNQVSVGSFMTFGAEICMPKPIERSGGENVKVRIKGGTRIKGGVRF